MPNERRKASNSGHPRRERGTLRREAQVANLKDIRKAVEQQDELVDIPIYQPNGEPYLARDGSQSTIGVYGAESKYFKAAQAAQSKKIQQSRKRSFTFAEQEQAKRELAAAVTGRWHGWEDGKVDLPCTPENAAVLYEVDHILAQVEVGIYRHSDFFSSASAS